MPDPVQESSLPAVPERGAETMQLTRRVVLVMVLVLAVLGACAPLSADRYAKADILAPVDAMSPSGNGCILNVAPYAGSPDVLTVFVGESVALAAGWGVRCVNLRTGDKVRIIGRLVPWYIPPDYFLAAIYADRVLLWKSGNT